MFTTMSTVGFGDMHPLNSAERIMCAMTMILGVSVFSLIISMFQEIFSSFKEIDSDFCNLDELNLFFDGMAKNFNRGQRLNIKLEENFIDYFNYKWENDKLTGIKDDDEHMVMKRLPYEIQDEILTGFLYWEFLTTFMSFFKIKKPVADKINKKPGLFSKINYHVYYTWMDKPYQQFMESILFNLEPIRYN